jgi:hypothetical protein
MDTDAIAITLAGFGLILLILAVQRLRRARYLAAGSTALFGLLFLAVASGFFIVALNLRTYSRLTYEQPVAELVFEARGPQSFQAIVTQIPSGSLQILQVNGDDWQMDARILKWRSWANLLGLNAQYRLERFSGRYRDIEQERSAPRNVYPLADNPGVDIWVLAANGSRWVPFVDAVYGSATYLPMANGARYQVTLSQSGLVARPINDAASQAVAGWKTP